MKVSYKPVNGKRIIVDVSQRECPTFSCFGFHKYQHRGALMGGGSKSSGTDNFYSCPHRNYHGCPDKPKIKGSDGDE